MDPCESCSLEKSRRFNLRKLKAKPVNKPGNRLYIDTSWVRKSTRGGNNFWVLIVDEFIKMSLSLFMKKKSDLSREVRVIMNKLRDSRKEIMFIRVDNDGENVILQRDCIKEKMGIKFE